MSVPLWHNRRVVVCVGTGGVGKTTVAAAIAVAAAAQGKRTLVMTIDPARRLANALGLDDFGNIQHEIPAAALAPYGVTLRAPLLAMMPDVKRTFDDLIDRTAKDAAQRESIKANRFYQHFSTSLAGSLEYAAVEKLYEVYASNTYDLIVLDTPPLQNAVDFLGAPARIINFLEQETVQWLLKPYMLAGRLSLRLLDFGSNLIFRTLGRLAGGETLRQLVEFVQSFQGMYDGFRSRSLAVQSLLTSDDLAFVLVSTARTNDQESLRRFYGDLALQGLQTRAVIQNRVRAPVIDEGATSDLATRLHELLPESLLAMTQTAIDEERILAQKDAQAIASLRAELKDVEVVALPELPLDAHDLESLATLHTYLGGER